MPSACPIVRGRTRASFSFISRESPLTRGVVKPFGDGTRLGFFQAVHCALLLLQVAGVLYFCLNGFQFIADFCGEAERGGLRV